MFFILVATVFFLTVSLLRAPSAEAFPTTNAQINVTSTTAAVSIYFENPQNQTEVFRAVVWAANNSDPRPSNGANWREDLGRTTGTFGYTLGNLTPGTTYYVRGLRVLSGGQDRYGNVQSFTTPKSNQTLTFNTVPAKTVADPSFTVSPTASSGLTPTVTASPISVCSVSGFTVTINGAGTCTLTAAQGGNATYFAAPTVSRLFTVSKLNQTVTFNTVSAKTVTDPSFAVSPTASSGLIPTLTASPTSVCSASGFTVTINGAGTCTLTASQAGNATYNAATAVVRSFAVSKLNQTLTFTDTLPPAATVIDAPFTVKPATNGTGLTPTLSAGPVAVCAVTGPDDQNTFTVTINGAGTCTLTAAQPGNATYNAAASVVRTFNVAKLAQTLTFAAPPGKTFGAQPFTVSPTATSELTPNVSATPATVCSVTGSTVTINGAGTCTLTAAQGGNETYDAAPPVVHTFTVARAAQTIAFPSINTVTFSVPSIGVTVSASSTLAVTLTSDTPDICTVSGTQLTTIRHGECTLVAAQDGNDNYLPAGAISQTLTVLRAAQTITVSDGPQRTYGDTTFGPTTVTTSGAGLTPVLASETPDVCTTDGTHVTLLASGRCVLAATQAGDDRYLAASGVQLAIDVARKTLTVAGTLAVDSRVYDGTSSAAPAPSTNLSIAGVLADDLQHVTFAPTLMFASSNAGTHAVNVSPLSALSGPRAAHYVLSVVNAPTTTATITPRSLTVSHTVTVTRPYDGTTAVELPACETLAIVGVLVGDTVTLTCPTSGDVPESTPGTARPVTPAAPYVLAGTHAQNYTFIQPTLTVDITKASAQMWFTTGLVQILQSDLSGIALPAATVNPLSAGTLIITWHDGAPPTTPGRFRVNLTLDSQTHEAAPLATFVLVIATQSLPQGMLPPTIGPLIAPSEDGEPVAPPLPPSDVSGQVNNQPVIPTVNRPSDTDLQLEDIHSQVQVTFAARSNATATPRLLAAQTDLVLLAGGILDVTGSGFQPHSAVEVWMFSEPQLLGVVQVDGQGAFDTQFDVPRAVSAGEHVIQLNGVNSQNLLMSFSLGILVEVPASANNTAPLRNGQGQLFTARSGGPNTIMSRRPVNTSVQVGHGQQIRGLSRDTVTITHTHSASGFVVRLSPQPNGAIGRIVQHSVVVGRATIIDGSVEGFAPFTSVHVWALSEPRLLGRFVTNHEGAATFRVTLPDDVSYGLHTLQVAGMTRTGQQAGVAATLWVTHDTSPFVDVSHNDTHGAAVLTLKTHGHVTGFTDGMFKPHRLLARQHANAMLAHMFNGEVHESVATTGAMTRGEAAVMLAGLFTPTGQQNDSPGPFSDVIDAVQQAALTTLHTHGLVAGFNDGLFRPDEHITRAQFASLITRAQYQLAQL